MGVTAQNHGYQVEVESFEDKRLDDIDVASQSQRGGELMLDTSAANAINYMWSLESNEQRAIALQELFEEHENDTISNTHDGTSTPFGSLRMLASSLIMKLFESVRNKDRDNEFVEESENIHMDLDDILNRKPGP